jgi:SAM-dependent methyltransferase
VIGDSAWPPAAPPPLGSLWFRCNLCGGIGFAEWAQLGREESSCARCSSTGRERAIIRALSLELFGEALALPDFPPRRDIRGFGMTDSGRYADRLAEKFDYRNTFYHQEPHLDITMPSVAAELAESHDFIISSEVFEHIVPPVQIAFDNVYKILRPGGTFVLTVPYGLIPKTIEHFPTLHEFTLEETDGAYVLRNVRRDGTVEEFRDLVFHIGDGATVEMRVFGEADLVRHLQRAGFVDVKVHRTPDFAHGIWWPERWSFPISAKKPMRGET